MAESSSYPRSTTACRRARVTESLVANSVTSHPRDTSPSAMLPATVSQAPYCRGGVRQATGDRIATLLPVRMYLVHCAQYVLERYGDEAGSVVGVGIGNNQPILVDQGAARIHDVGHVTATLVLCRRQQRFFETADHLAGIVL